MAPGPHRGKTRTRRSTQRRQCGSETAVTAGAVYEPDQKKFAAAWAQCLANASDLDVEVRFSLPDRSTRWMKVRASMRPGEGSPVHSWHGTLEDIHDRKSTIAALQVADARYRYTIDLCELIPWSAGP